MRPSKRIALLLNSVPPYRLPILREFAQRFDSFRVFVSGESLGADQLPVQRQRCFTVRTTWRHPNGFKEPLGIHVPYDTIPQLIRFDPDVVISAELGLRTLQAAAFTSMSAKRQLFVWAAMSEVTEQGRGMIRPHLRRTLLRAASGVMVNGESGARYITRFGVPEEKIFRVPQTTEIGPFLNAYSTRDRSTRHRLLYCGRLIELKGLLPFLTRLRAWAERNREKNLEFSIAGDGPLRSAIAAFACPENLRLTMLGNVSYDRLPEIYANAGIFAFPTLSDEWGLVVVEAMAAGLPVLGSAYSQAVEDLIKDGSNGWTFHPDREAEVDSAIDRALGTPVETVNSMGERAHTIARNMTPARMVDQMMDAVEYARERTAVARKSPA